MNRDIDVWEATLLCYVQSQQVIAAPAARTLWCNGWLVEEIAAGGAVPVALVQDWLNFRKS